MRREGVGALTINSNNLSLIPTWWKEAVDSHMFDGPALPVQGEQTGGVPPFQGGLGDELLRELEIKIRSFQGLHPFQYVVI